MRRRFTSLLMLTPDLYTLNIFLTFYRNVIDSFMLTLVQCGSINACCLLAALFVSLWKHLVHELYLWTSSMLLVNLCLTMFLCCHVCLYVYFSMVLSLLGKTLETWSSVQVSKMGSLQCCSWWKPWGELSTFSLMSHQLKDTNKSMENVYFASLSPVYFRITGIEIWEVVGVYLKDIQLYQNHPAMLLWCFLAFRY